MLKSHCRKSTWIWEVLLWWFLEHRIGIALLHFRSVVELNRAVNNEAVEWMLVFLGDCAPWGWELAPISFFVHLCMFSADRYSAKLYLLSTQWQLFHPFFSTKKKNPWIHQGHPVPCHDGPAAKKKKKSASWMAYSSFLTYWHRNDHEISLFPKSWKRNTQRGTVKGFPYQTREGDRKTLPLFLLLLIVLWK